VFDIRDSNPFSAAPKLPLNAAHSTSETDTSGVRLGNIASRTPAFSRPRFAVAPRETACNSLLA
jgi:hypothetical protein